MLLVNGEMPRFDEEGRAPTTAAGVSEDGATLHLAAIDGRQERLSRGVSYHEMAELLKARGAWNAVSLDGGGSTAMAARDPITGVVGLVNRPSDVVNGYPIVDRARRC
jgi:exopolysaccharide biosynthesis protein